MINRPYQPIDCGLYDYLEKWATLRTQVEIIYIDENKVPKQITTLIADLKTISSVEYLILPNKTTLRLDDILTINGKDFSGTCSL
jgi:Rho-binding antiterminator